MNTVLYMEAGNYVYDAIGNLEEGKQQQTTISWTPYGKVSRVTKCGNGYTEFRYDVTGNRVSKKRVNAQGLAVTNYYVRDASGNIMAVYEKTEQAGTTPEIILTELPIYGSDRIGQYIQSVAIADVKSKIGETNQEIFKILDAWSSYSMPDDDNSFVLKKLNEALDFWNSESGRIIEMENKDLENKSSK